MIWLRRFATSIIFTATGNRAEILAVFKQDKNVLQLEEKNGGVCHSGEDKGKDTRVRTTEISNLMKKISLAGSHAMGSTWGPRNTTCLLTLAILAGAGAYLVSAPVANAAIQTYDFNFTGGDGVDASGTITVDNGVADGGTINVTGVPVEADPSMLVTASGSLLTAGGDVRDRDGDVISYDTVANPLNDPVFDNNGVAFGSGYYGSDGGTPIYDTVVNIWGNGPGSYSLFVGEAQVDANNNLIGDAQWVYYQSNGSLTLTVATVPEASAFGPAAACGLLVVGGISFLRRSRPASMA